MAQNNINAQLIKHIPGFLKEEHASDLCAVLEAIIPWQKFAPSPKSRLVYMWNTLIAQMVDPQINQIFQKLINEINRKYRTNIQNIFCNLYKNGQDYCPYHKDMYRTHIFTLSLGQTRDFLVKPDQKGTKSTKYTLNSGDLYFMHNDIHNTHKHSIPKRKHVEGTRISIVFFC